MDRFSCSSSVHLCTRLEIELSDKNSKIHKGAYKYIKSLGFILNQSKKKQLELDSNTQLKHYWKYDKIGVNKFLI